MIRLACLLTLVALASAVLVVVDTTGVTATVLMFVGAPCLVVGLALYALALRRAVRRGEATRPLSSQRR